MSIFRKRVSLVEANDSSLVMYSLGGDRDAFCQIVTRYQNLLCSLAYSSIGDVKYSEDIAQETFVEAWTKLDTLQDPEKLKAWLCGIMRFKVSRYRRKEDSQPIKGADELNEHKLPEKQNVTMEDDAIDKQQQALLWKVLDEIEDTYREPLILFYREQQSIARVAAELDLTQDTVKQRLSRGRKMLSKAMSSIVEEGLKNSKPGVAFTAAVMTVISGISPPVKAAVIGTTAAKTTTFVKFTTFLTLFAAISGLISSFFGLKAGLDQSRTQRERQLVIKSVVLFMSFAAFFVVGMFGLKYLALSGTENAGVYAVLSQGLVLAFVVSYLVLVSKLFAAMKNLRAQERIFEPQAFQREADQPGAKQGKYISSFSLFGVPLVHMQFGMPEKDDKPAFGWVAGGNHAHGLLFAWGGVAIAPVSVGIASVGIITIGAVGVGVFSMGTVAIGAIAFGASAIGYKAYASLSSLGWAGAFSDSFSIAKEAAIGRIAYASHVNNERAAELVSLDLFNQTYLWALAALAVLVVVPAIWYSSKVKQRMGNK